MLWRNAYYHTRSYTKRGELDMKSFNKAAEALIDTKLAMKHKLLRENVANYSLIANLGTNVEKRYLYLPNKIEIGSESWTFFSAGFQGFLYVDPSRKYLMKTNYNFSFEVQREWETYKQTIERIKIGKISKYVKILENNIKLEKISKDSKVVRKYSEANSGAFRKYFGDEYVLIKELINGKNIREIVSEREGNPNNIKKKELESIANIFKVFGETGVLLQGDPEDFILKEGEDNAWFIIDPDGWVIYEPDDEYVKATSRQTFIGTFSREWGSDENNLTSEYNKNLAPNFRKYCNLLMEKVMDIAKKYFGNMFVRPIDPDSLRELLDRENPLNPKNKFLKAFLRKELNNLFKLDNEMGRCSLNVIITKKQLFEDLLKLRQVSNRKSLKDFYFGDLGFIKGREYVVIYNSYNDALNERSHHWAYNHTGITNKEISERVLTKLEKKRL